MSNAVENYKIKLTVSTGWSGCDHVSYEDTPIHWDKLDENEKDDWLIEAAEEFLHEVCSSSGEIVESGD